MGIAIQCQTLSSLVFPLACIATLFAGSLLMELLSVLKSPTTKIPPSDEDGDYPPMDTTSAWLISLRTYVIAPLCEEWVFRCCLVPVFLLAGFSTGVSLAAPSIAFGLCHFHHAFEMRRHGADVTSIALVLFAQFGYTTVFGLIAGALFVSSGNALAIALAHAFCNYLGLPSLAWLHIRHPLYSWRYVLLLAHAVSIASFVWLVYPAMSSSVDAKAYPCAILPSPSSS